MDDELIKRLRDAATTSEALAVLLPHSEGNATAKLYNEAADAIDQLSKLADAIHHVCECCIGCEMEKKNGGCDNAFVLSPKRAMQYLIKPRWIPVTERLPERNGTYLVYVYGDVTDLNYWYGKWRRLGDDYTKAVTHWMPLPEPPKEAT